MVSRRCKIAVKEALKKMGLHFIFVELGEIDLMEELTEDQKRDLNTELLSTGLELMDDKKAILIERIKNVIVEMVHYTEDQPKINFSNFLSERLNHDYSYLSNLFSEVSGITIEHFIIAHKIERIKELISYDELNFTEISYLMNYSSVAHLSTQFKKSTGLSPSEFKKLMPKKRKSIEEI